MQAAALAACHLVVAVPVVVRHRWFLAVEWADRLPAALPADRLEVRLERQGTSIRRLEARSMGAGSEALLARWRAELLEVGVALECR